MKLNSVGTKIQKLDEQIVLLNNLKSQCLTKLESFPQIAVNQSTAAIIQQSFDDKIALFKSYFRGRDDVYSKLWTNNCFFIIPSPVLLNVLFVDVG